MSRDFSLLRDQINFFIRKNNLISPDSRIVLGLSGGPDSVFLLYYFKDLYKKKEIAELLAAHLDHEWREDSAQDFEFCKKLCAELNIPFVGAKISQLDVDLKKSRSQEEKGRIARRYFLEHVMQENEFNQIALAHHLQDQEETFFIRLIRGTTLTGLIGMRPQSGPYIRPLLEIKKSDILEYLDYHAIQYITDPSNISDTFLRNRIRKNVLPELEKCDQRFNANFLKTLNNLKESEKILQQITHHEFEKISKVENSLIKIDVKKLLLLSEYMQNQVILHWLIHQNVSFTPTTEFLEEIRRFLMQPEGKTHHIHPEWSIVKKKQVAYIKRANEK